MMMLHTISTIKRSEVVTNINEIVGMPMPETESAKLNRKVECRQWHKVYSIEVDDTSVDPKSVLSWKMKGRTGSGRRCGGCEGCQCCIWSELRSWPTMWAISGCPTRMGGMWVIEVSNDRIWGQDDGRNQGREVK